MIAFEDIPDDVHGDVLRRMRGNGDSLTQERPIDFSVIFPTEQAAVAFCKAISTEAVELSYEQAGAGEERPWDVTVTSTMVPDHAAIVAMEKWIVTHAEALDGRNDGWGCLEVPDMAKNCESTIVDMPKVDFIDAVGIDLDGPLWLRPRTASFPMVCREGREVQWNREERHLYAPKPRQWTYVDWFRHVLSTASEQGVELWLTPETEWVCIDEELRRELQSARSPMRISVPAIEGSVDKRRQPEGIKVRMHRKLLIALAILALPAFADARSLPPRDCGLERAWAALAMQARQMGVTMEEQLPLANPEIGGSKAVLALAYRVPRYDTPKKRAQAADAFGLRIEKTCMRNSK